MKNQQFYYYSNKNIKKNKEYYLPFYIFLQVFLLFFLTFIMIFQNTRYKDLEKKFYNQVVENRKLEETILPIELEIRRLTRNDILEKLAEKEYFLYPVKDDQIIRAK